MTDPDAWRIRVTLRENDKPPYQLYLYPASRGEDVALFVNLTERELRWLMDSGDTARKALEERRK